MTEGSRVKYRADLQEWATRQDQIGTVTRGPYDVTAQAGPFVDVLFDGEERPVPGIRISRLEVVPNESKADMND